MESASRRSFLASVGVTAFLGIAGCTSTGDTQTETTSDSTPSNGFRVDVVAENLVVPWDLDFDGDGRVYLTERPGNIDRLDLDTGDVRTLANVTDTAPVGEGGLLGIALHPDFPDPPSLFVYQTYRSNGLRNRILRYRVDGDSVTRVGTVLDGIPGGQIHDGGRLAIGPDGMLYATTGDAGTAAEAQNRDSLAGKVLRLNLDGSVPTDNPFDGNPVWSLGHRNPEGLAWHPDSGHLYEIEHGSSGFDEVNRIDAGANYGWPIVRGNQEDPEFVSPVLTSGPGTWAPSGGSFYDGDAFPDWYGDLFFATLGFSSGDGRRSLHWVRFGEDGVTVAEHERFLENEYGRLRGVGIGPDGHIYVTTSNEDGRGSPASTDDRILRLRPA